MGAGLSHGAQVREMPALDHGVKNTPGCTVQPKEQNTSSVHADQPSFSRMT
jgi:hypothetical protein